MNTNLEQVLTETIVSSKKAVGEAVEWALKQAPDICEQYLRYEMISAIISACLLAILGMALVYVYYKIWKFLDKEEDDGTKFFARLIIGVFAGAALFGVIAGIETHAKNAVKIQVAPKVYLVEFATKLVK